MIKECVCKRDAGCVCTDYKECPPKCSFYLNEKTYMAKTERSFQLLEALPESAQRVISKKYYDGRRPWRE